MGRFVAVEFLSLDGYMTGDDGDQSAFAASWSADLDEETRAQQATAGAILLGRVAYEQMSSYWTSAEAQTEDPVVLSFMTTSAKFVVSRTLAAAPWGSGRGADVVASLDAQSIEGLRRSVEGDILIIGSGRVVRSMQALDAIDEYKIMLFPALLGSGRRLFERQAGPRRLRLTRAHLLSGGVHVLQYSTRRT